MHSQIKNQIFHCHLQRQNYFRRVVNLPEYIVVNPTTAKNEDKQVGKEENNLVKNIYKQKTQSKLATFLHATSFIPDKPTVIKEIKTENLETWPGLTAN